MGADQDRIRSLCHSLLEKLFRNFSYLKVFVRNSNLQLYQLIKIRVSNKKMFEQQYCGIYEDLRFTFVTKLLRTVAYAEICEGGFWNRKNDRSKWSW